MKDMH